ncbi:MAG: HlyD family efflux transporter periplasmic adaptor subunit, partial [Patescibacteria group bacterium]
KSIDALNVQDQFTLNNTVLDVEIKNIALKNASLYAPFAGVLVSAPTEIAGTIVSATDVFLVVNPASMTFLADVDEADISKIKEEMTATIKLDAYPQLEIPVNVHRIAYQSSEASTGTVFGVEFELPAEYNNIHYRLGMNGNVKILIDRKESVMSVPVRAITERDGKNYVDVAIVGDKSGKTIQKEVQLGLEDENYVEIQSGLQASDRVWVR